MRVSNWLEHRLAALGYRYDTPGFHEVVDWPTLTGTGPDLFDRDFIGPLELFYVPRPVRPEPPPPPPPAPLAPQLLYWQDLVKR